MSGMNHGNDRIYWPGNAAKASIIQEILTVDVVNKPSLRIFDFGCGDGGDWPSILADHPELQLVGYEPSYPRVRAARERLDGRGARLYTGDELTHLDCKFDVVVSLSVFEHVYDRAAYLAHARRLLADHGRLYLNYDDGHFRYPIDLGWPENWRVVAKEFATTLVAPLRARFGRLSRYQRRCSADEIDSLVRTAGFEIDRVEYHNLADLKGLYKTIPQAQRNSFMQLWLGLEKQLNERFLGTTADPARGDRSNLWRAMLSRTLTCRPVIASMPGDPG